MSHSAWFDKIDRGQYVTQYMPGMKIVPRYSFNSYPDGGLITSVEDLSRYAMEVMRAYHGESRILRQESVREMLSPSWWKPGTGGYHMFWVLRADGTKGHHGGHFGITTSMHFNPARNIGAIVFTNASFNDRSPAQRQFQDVEAALMADYGVSAN